MKKKETIVKNNKIKCYFFEKINKIEKSLASLIKKKGEKNQINKIRKFKQLYKIGNKIGHLKEMDRFSECSVLKDSTRKK